MEVAGLLRQIRTRASGEQIMQSFSPHTTANYCKARGVRYEARPGVVPASKERSYLQQHNRLHSYQAAETGQLPCNFVKSAVKRWDVQNEINCPRGREGAPVTVTQRVAPSSAPHCRSLIDLSCMLGCWSLSSPLDVVGEFLEQVWIQLSRAPGDNHSWATNMSIGFPCGTAVLLSWVSGADAAMYVHINLRK
ncbi:hypothetical protein TgHK011_007719 [Trichoderma gracile]|nr:hypothetical protein TgHK011_007719 [Trichoderma gracile]